MKKVVLFVMAMVFLASSAFSEQNIVELKPLKLPCRSKWIPATEINRVIDKQAGVICYYLDNKGGLSCIPLKDTRFINRIKKMRRK